MAPYELAQMNLARLRAPLDSPQLADFVGALDRINALADGSDGFFWRLQDESGNATGPHPMGEDVIVNMSVWRDSQSLQAFVYRSCASAVLARTLLRSASCFPHRTRMRLPQAPRNALPGDLTSRQ